MSGTASRFVGGIPANYDCHLGPNIFEPYADDLARRAGEEAAQSVLELAAGTGIVSRKLRDALPAAARLVVSDLNPPMLDIAREKFRDGESVELVEADAMALPFAEGEFDLIVCQFGVMFFPDRVASYREAARVLAPGGRYLFNTWGTMEANPFAAIAHAVTARFFPDDPPGFYRVPFSCADPAVTRAELAAAGWSEVEHETLPCTRRVTDFAAFARGLVHGNPLGAEIEARGGVAAGEVVAAIAGAFEARWGAAPAAMPLEATVFTARRH